MATYNFTVRAEDDRGAFSDRTFSIQVQNNLVDRYVMIDSQNLYASVDGSNFTIRSGKGGAYTHYMLGKWVVFYSAYTTVAANKFKYRISNDTINWTEGLETRVHADSEEHANSLFTFDAAIPFEYGGYVYAIASSDDGSWSGTVRTNDWIKWELITESIPLISSQLKGMYDKGLRAGLKNISYLNFSNIVRHDGKFAFFNTYDNSVVLTSDFKEFETKPMLGNLYHTTPSYDMGDLGTFTTHTYFLQGNATRISSLNGILLVAARWASVYATSSGYPVTYRFSYNVTADLRNYINPAVTSVAPSTTTLRAEYIAHSRESSPKAPLYYNGHNIIKMGILSFNTIDPLNPTLINSGSFVGNMSHSIQNVVLAGQQSKQFRYSNNGQEFRIFDGKLLSYEGFSSYNTTIVPEKVTNTTRATTGFPSEFRSNKYYINDSAVRGQ